MLWEGPGQGCPGNPGCPQGLSSNIQRPWGPTATSLPGCGPCREILPWQHRSGKPRAGSVVELSLLAGLSLAGLLGLGFHPPSSCLQGLC